MHRESSRDPKVNCGSTRRDERTGGSCRVKAVSNDELASDAAVVEFPTFRRAEQGFHGTRTENNTNGYNLVITAGTFNRGCTMPPATELSSSARWASLSKMQTRSGKSAARIPAERFNLREDLGESHDLAKQHPKVV